jgi:hypothetical protein
VLKRGEVGPLGIRFLLTGDDSGGSVSVFEVLVPVVQKLTTPAPSRRCTDADCTAVPNWRLNSAWSGLT